MLRDYYRYSEFVIELFKRSQKFRGGNRVKLRGRLIKYYYPGIHRGYRRESNRLFLTARKLGSSAVKERINAEIAHGFGEAPAHERLGVSEVFHTEGNFMPDLVGDCLMLRGLLNETYFYALIGGELPGLMTAEKDFSACFSSRSELGLKAFEQSCLSASRGTAKCDEISAFYFKIDAFQYFFVFTVYARV